MSTTPPPALPDSGQAPVAPSRSEAAFARQLQGLVRDLIAPDPRIYWGDFLGTTLVAYGGLWLYLSSPLLSAARVAGFFIAAFALYRDLMFIHELAHLPRKRFRLFRAAWNLLVGVPFMTPEFLYTEHRTHHVNHSYGTHSDAEYVPIGRGPVAVTAAFIAQGLLMPVLAVIRFGLLTPLSLFSRRLRKLVWERASGLTQNNPHFRRAQPNGRERVIWGLQEAGCFGVVAGVIGLMVADIVPWFVLLELYVLFAFVTTVSFARALASHLYWNEGQPMSYLEQMLDSTTVPGHPLLTELWAPLGQRYHALHHLIPSLPYHALGVAHRRLLQQLPADSPYRQTIRPSLWASLREIFCRAAEETRRRTRAA